MKEKFENFMKDRYGGDLLNGILAYLGLEIAIINFFRKSTVLSFVSMSLIAVVIFRAFSKNKRQRAIEQVKFFNFISPIYSRLLKFKNKDRKNYKYFKCSNCKKELRVPKGKGKIKVKCPNCGHEEIKKS